MYLAWKTIIDFNNKIFLSFTIPIRTKHVLDCCYSSEKN